MVSQKKLDLLKWSKARRSNFFLGHCVVSRDVSNIYEEHTKRDLKVTEMSNEERHHFPPVSCVHNCAESSRDIV